ncbi:MAG: GNAT family N-acetyltransferase [Vulcanimicrobiaceae bacterium]
MTTSLHVRLATPSDAAAVAAIYAPFVASTHVSFEEQPPTVDEVRQRLTAARDVWPWVVCERGGEVAGYVYATAHRMRAGYRFSVDTSSYVHERHRRAGVARLAYGALFRLLAQQRYYNAFAGIALPNDASLALHESLGFREIARYANVGYKAGAWHDTVWLQRPLRALETPPLEPRPLAALDPRDVAACLTIG